MQQINWITPTGLIANFLIGVPVSTQLLSYNIKDRDDAISYSIISGKLPPGITLNSNGIISGIPTYDTPTDNYFVNRSYTFIVRPISSSGVYGEDRQFVIAINNIVNNDFTWVTPAGNLGTVLNGEYFQYQLRVEQSYPGGHITFSFISGELPSGTQITPAGLLQGIPTILEATEVNQSRTYKFTIRAANELNHIIDQSFSISVTNIYGPIVYPTTTYLGSVFDGSQYSLQLRVPQPNPNVSIQWSNIGPLPPGLQLTSTGLITGLIQPVPETGKYGPAGYDGFSSSAITNVTQIIPGKSYTIRFNGNTDFTKIGSVSNIIGQMFTANSVGTGTGTVSIYAPDVVTQSQEYDSSPYDFNALFQSYDFKFTVQAFDGANYDQQDYVMNIVSRSRFTADNDVVTIDNAYLSIDSSTIYYPLLLNANTTVLPQGRAGSYYSYKFDGYDIQGDTVTYGLTNTVGTFDAYVIGKDAGFDYGSMDPSTLRTTPDWNIPGVGFDSAGLTSALSGSSLPGLILDEETGWLYGKLNSQTTALQEYTFGVILSKNRNGTNYSIDPIYFTLPVLGDITNVIEWVSPSSLGKIPNGSVSDLAIEATSTIGKKLQYELYNTSDVSVRLPQGITLLPSGELSGRVTFQATCIDDYTTTFDSDVLTLDRDCEFTVRAYSTDGTVESTKQFTLSIDVVDTEPYEDLYLQALLPIEQRLKLQDIISISEIFNPEYIYRYNDPWFGIRPGIEMLLLPGLKPSEVNAYATAILRNHFTKKYDFGEFKTAVVLDENYNVKYEVVYVDVVDPGENPNSTLSRIGPLPEISLKGVIANSYIDADGNSYKILQPNSSENMIDALVSAIGYIDQSTLPPWMTSNQLGTSGNKFNTPLGFVKAAVIAYTKPGYSKQIAYRLNQANITFNEIEFTVDRYFLDNFYSRNYDTVSGSFILGRETTFDQLPNKKVGQVVATVNYGVAIPYNQINGRSVEYIKSRGGLDGITSFYNGDTLVFTQQEGFLNAGPYNGWVRYVDAYIGDNITTRAIEGYDSEEFDLYKIVPGYLEKTQTSSPAVQTTATKIESDSLTTHFVGNGINTIFAPLPGLSTTENTVIKVNGTTLTPVVDYRVSGDTVLFIAPPAVNADIQVTISSLTGLVTVTDTSEILAGAYVIFQGTSFGGISAGQTYIIQSVIDSTHFTINNPVSTTNLASESFIGTGSQKSFVLTTTPSSSNITVYVNGLVLDGSSDYTVSGRTVTINIAPEINVPVNISYLVSTGGGKFFTATGNMTAGIYSNERGGVWKINITNGVVSLQFIQEVGINDRVQILSGQTNNAAVMLYVMPDSPGQTSPYYKPYKYVPSTQSRTTFNGNSTKFFSNRDRYYSPGEYDQYVKFPGINVFGETAANFRYYEIVDTAQAKCFNANVQILPPAAGASFYGQDAQFTRDLPNYTFNLGGRTVIDNVTGLEWMKGPNTTLATPSPTDKKIFSDAKTYVNTINSMKYAGYEDWRLPTIKELYSLMKFNGVDPVGFVGSTSLLIPFIDNNYFNFSYGQPSAGEALTDSQYITGTHAAVVSGNSSPIIFGINFATGEAAGYDLQAPGQPEKTFFVQLVRGNSYGFNAFTNNNNGTITDSASGLMWERNDSAIGMTWESALKWAQTKNDQKYLGYSDWRLPNAKELQSIVNFSNSPDHNGLPAIDTNCFVCTRITNEAGVNDFPYYWTSTTHETNGLYPGSTAVYIAFGRALGFDSYDNKWVDIHGAGSQRSDPKVAPPYAAPYQQLTSGWVYGPKKAATRGMNFVRLVRNL